ncbi:MAG: ribonuclease HIII [Bacilli bacterium]|jgi:ribonuclease HIII|nr:ribonuclease HIII [Bacilli bacterium]
MNVVIQGNEELINIIRQYYDHEIDQVNKVPHTKFTITSKNYKVIAYNSNKIMFQGKEAIKEAEIWQKHLGECLTKKTTTKKVYQNNFTNINKNESIGSDEVGTGDYFGPVVVCACYINEQIINHLLPYQINDSKLMDDEYIIEIAGEISKYLPHVIYIIDNKTYNKIQPTNNLNQIKAKMHNYVIGKLIKKINKKPLVIIDQFCSKENYFKYLSNTPNTIIKEVHMETKAESKYLAVALASILARNAFLEEMDKLSAQIKMDIPKGASSYVDNQGVKIVEKYGLDILDEIAKKHFKNTTKIMEKLKQ